MSDKERTGVRDQTYSGWHRRDSQQQYLSTREAWELGMIDIDSLEYCRYCYKPLALIETQVSENDPKDAPVMAGLATRASINAYSVSYVKSVDGQIELFRVRQLAPERGQVQDMIPKVYSFFLHSLRVNHQREVGCPAVPQQCDGD